MRRTLPPDIIKRYEVLRHGVLTVRGFRLSSSHR